MALFLPFSWEGWSGTCSLPKTEWSKLQILDVSTEDVWMVVCSGIGSASCDLHILEQGERELRESTREWRSLAFPWPTQAQGKNLLSFARWLSCISCLSAYSAGWSPAVGSPDLWSGPLCTVARLEEVRPNTATPRKRREDSWNRTTLQTEGEDEEVTDRIASS